LVWRVDPSFRYSVTGSGSRAKCSNILQDKTDRLVTDRETENRQTDRLVIGRQTDKPSVCVCLCVCVCVCVCEWVGERKSKYFNNDCGKVQRGKAYLG
jgi:hypothetical protein